MDFEICGKRVSISDNVEGHIEEELSQFLSSSCNKEMREDYGL